MRFESAAVERAARTALGVPEGAINAEDLEAVTALDLSGQGLTELPDLSGFTALESLDLSGNALTDVSALASLSGLQTLNLEDNALTDVTPLASLTGLTSLRLAGNDIIDPTQLAALTDLSDYSGPTAPWPTGTDAVIVGLWVEDESDLSAQKEAFEQALLRIGIGRTGSLKATAEQLNGYLDSCVAGELQSSSGVNGVCVFSRGGADCGSALAHALQNGVAVYEVAGQTPEEIYEELLALYGVQELPWPTDADAVIVVIYTEAGGANEILMDAVDQACLAVGCPHGPGRLTASEENSAVYLEYCANDRADGIQGVLLFPYDAVNYSGALALADAQEVAVRRMFSEDPAEVFDAICALYGRTDIANPYR